MFFVGFRFLSLFKEKLTHYKDEHIAKTYVLVGENQQ